MIRVIGAGGVGWWTAVGLARDLPIEEGIQVWDNDTISETGALRLPYGYGEKASQLHAFITYVMGDRQIDSVGARFGLAMAAQHVEEDDLIVDCTDDDIERRKIWWGYCKEKGAKILRVSYDGDGAIVEISGELPLYVGGVRSGDYRSRPNLALSFFAGGIGAYIALQYKTLDLTKLHVRLSLEEAIESGKNLLANMEVERIAQEEGVSQPVILEEASSTRRSEGVSTVAENPDSADNF